MKSSELHKLIKRKGWVLIRSKGSHYIYEKNGKRIPVPYHGSAEVAKGLQNTLKRRWGYKTPPSFCAIFKILYYGKDYYRN